MQVKFLSRKAGTVSRTDFFSCFRPDGSPQLNTKIGLYIDAEQAVCYTIKYRNDEKLMREVSL